MCQAVDQRADIFAMGVSMWELLYGDRPFSGQTGTELLACIERGPTSPKVKTSSSRLHALVAAMIAYDPAARPQSMEAVIAGLQRCKPKPRARHRIALAAGVMIAGAGIASAIFATTQRAADVDPCRAAQEELDAIWNGETSRKVQDGLSQAGASNQQSITTVSKLSAWAADISHQQQVICKQPANHIANACLEARINELAAVTTTIADIESDELTALPTLLNTKLEPIVCSSAGVSIGESRWPFKSGRG
jgi:eukaryotic-like serine/threonine-protein kinase